MGRKETKRSTDFENLLAMLACQTDHSHGIAEKKIYLNEGRCWGQNVITSSIF
jgi:hypothetical protein